MYWDFPFSSDRAKNLAMLRYRIHVLVSARSIQTCGLADTVEQRVLGPHPRVGARIERWYDRIKERIEARRQT